MLGQTLFTGYFSLALVYVACRLVFKTTGPQLLLSGLSAYFCIDPSKGLAATTQDELRSKKSRKAYEKQKLEIQGAEAQIYKQRIGTQGIHVLPLADDINTLFMLAAATTLNTVVVFFLAAAFDVQAAHIATNLTAISLVYLLFVLLKAEVLGKKSPGVKDYSVLAIFVGCGAAVALGALVWVPTLHRSTPSIRRWGPILDFKLGSAAHGLDALLDSVMQRISNRIGIQHMPRHTEPQVLATGASSLAGVLAAFLVGPALRLARLLHSSSYIPAWGDKYLRHGWLAMGTLKLAALLPLLVSASQFLPLYKYWGAPPVASPSAVTAVLLLATALVHICALPVLCQAYLNGGLIEWNTLLHNGVEKQNKLTVVRMRLDMIRALLCKAATQLLALPYLACLLGLLLVANSPLVPQVARMAQGPRERLHSVLPVQLTSMLRPGQDASASMSQAYPGDAQAAMSVNISGSALGSNHTQGGSQPAHEPGDVLYGLTEDGSAVSVSEVGKEAAASSKGITSSGSEHSDRAKEPGSFQDLLAFLGTFYGWWSCTVFVLYSYSALVVYRLGLNIG